MWMVSTGSRRVLREQQYEREQQKGEEEEKTIRMRDHYVKRKRKKKVN